MGRGGPRGPLAWLGGLLCLYLAWPLVAFAVRFVTASRRGFHVPGLFPALGVSAACATISLGVMTVLGVPLAYLLARSKGRVASAVGLVVQLPLALPPLMSGIILIYVIGPYTWLGRHFGGHLTDSMTGVVIAMTFVSAPFLIVAARAGFATVDAGLYDVAATLGHGELSRFLRVALPAAGPGVRAGMLLAWLRAFGEYGAVVILAYNPATLPVYAYNQFSGIGLPTTLAPTALSIVVAVAAVGLSRLRAPARRAAPTMPTVVAPSPAAPAPVGFALDHRVGSFRLSLEHHSRGRLSVVGPSGSGKSTLLRALAGLYGATPGEVSFGSDDVGLLAAEDRGVGYVAQGFGLFSHLTVWRQLTFARDASPGLASYWLEHLHLTGLERRYPAELSGGQRQRVALAQALTRSPRVLLLDEPLSSLDVPVRLELRRELRRLQIDTGMSSVIVTHDPEEAAYLADEVIVLDHGVALQAGATRDVFSRPASPEVARLLGIANLHRGVVVEPGLIDSLGARVAVDTMGLAAGSAVLWAVRPERVRLTGAADAEAIPGAVVDVADVGVGVDLLVTLAPGLDLVVRSFDSTEWVTGDRCGVLIEHDAITMWESDLDVTSPAAAPGP
ncbi:MAG: ATP-binding cassette domain-containing protein [Acidimicrobiales bacterium]